MRLKITLLIVIVFTGMGCEKQDKWLDIKSRKADVIPTRLKDFQAILNNTSVMNEAYPILGMLSTDNLVVTDQLWSATSTAQLRNAYIWAKEIYNGDQAIDWRRDYSRVFYANIVLDGLVKYETTDIDKAEYDRIKGSALFFRSLAYYNLVQMYAETYIFKKSTNALGIPLRTSSDINAVSQRSKLEETYAVIIQDLVLAEQLVGHSVEIKTQVSKLAVKALLARVYLSIQDYDSAMTKSESVIAEAGGLIDFNTLNATSPFPMPGLLVNREILFYSMPSQTSMLYNSRVEPMLYKLYANDDLRGSLFYKDNGATGFSFRGQYTGLNFSYFSGLATNEQYLIAAECYARKGQIHKAMEYLNLLLISRWKKGTYIPLSTTTSEDALKMVLEERRKELPFTGTLRWEDLRRLNLDPTTSTELRRFVNGEYFTLMPNDKKYVFPIPDEEIRLSGLKPNER